MFRLVAASRVIREAVPEELVPVFLAITLLGSAKFLIFGLSLAYWNLPDYREEVLSVVSVAFVALTVTLVLKYGIDLPRPPEPVQRYPTETSGVGFPSGHAIASTVVYGGTAVALSRHRDVRMALAVGALIVAISLSRVVLGVHYLGDVVVGAVIGLALLAAIAVAIDRHPAYFFGAAAVLSVPALVVSGGDPDALLAFGGSLGGLAGSIYRTAPGTIRSRVERAVLNVGGLGFVGTLVLAADAVEGVLPLATGLNFLLAFGIIALPWAVGRVVPTADAPVADR